MPLHIYPVEDQIKGGFNNGAILENKPIQVSEDRSKLQPYSNIFYWAHAWSDHGSTIGEHPHKGFEIMSFVLDGNLEHHDSKNRSWVKLGRGDAQIIRAGSGISHSERIIAGSHMFQIWLDPNLAETLPLPASYDDYPASGFPVKHENSMTVIEYAGDGAPMTMHSPGVRIREMIFPAGEYSLGADSGSFFSFYLVSGELELSEGLMKRNDFAVAEDKSEIRFRAGSESRIFVIESPKQLPYRTYAERYR